MARKVFVSFLGTNNYIETKYRLGEFISQPVRFVQEALISHLCKDWTENDVVLIFHTKESHDRNWVNDGQDPEHKRGLSEIEKQGLETRLGNLTNINARIESHKIPEGFNEMEIWEIFNIVYDHIEDNDNIYFDVTHAFRSIPLFAIPLFNYAKLMKNAKIVSIHYGAFEKLGPVNKVKEIPIEDRIADIVDLTSIAKLQDTSIAASRLLSYDKIKSLTDTNTANSAALNKVRTGLANLNQYIITCNIAKLQRGDYMRTLLSGKNELERLNDVATVKPADLQLIQSQIATLQEFFKPQDTTDNIIGAIKWACAKMLPQQAYTLAQEFIVQETKKKVNEFYEEKYYPFEWDNLPSDFVSNVLGANLEYPFVYRVGSSKIKISNQELSTFGCDIQRQRWFRSMHQSYNDIRTKRNALNHGKGENIDSVRSLCENCITKLNECLLWLN